MSSAMLQKPSRSGASSNNTSTLRSSGCKIASWLGSGLYTAFFVSLDRCSCVKLDTIDALEPREQPLLFQHRRHSSTAENNIQSTARSSAVVMSKSSRRATASVSRPLEDDYDDDFDFDHDNSGTQR